MDTPDWALPEPPPPLLVPEPPKTPESQKQGTPLLKPGVRRKVRVSCVCVCVCVCVYVCV